MSIAGLHPETMTSKPLSRLLVIGPDALRDAVAAALPQYEIIVRNTPLDGLWTSGHQDFAGVLIALSGGADALRALRSVREVRPDLRIVVTCTAAEEPFARRAVAEGADEYLLEPLRAEEVARAFGIATRQLLAGARIASTGTRSRELQLLTDALKNLSDGAQATTERLAALLQDAFDAVGVAVEHEDLFAAVGDVAHPLLEQEIVREGQVVGRIALGRKRAGLYAATVAGRLSDYASLVEAIILQAHEREHWRHVAWTDELTGLRNRRFFDQALEQLIARAGQERFRITVLMFDIDDFKHYNDSFGHDVGDDLLREVARLLRQTTRERDIVARYGGDEFAVIFWDSEAPRLPGSKHPTDPIQLTARFCAAVRAHDFQFLGQEGPGRVTVSGGIACFPWDGATRDAMIAAADRALLDAKRTGKNQIVLVGGDALQSDECASDAPGDDEAETDDPAFEPDEKD